MLFALITFRSSSKGHPRALSSAILSPSFALPDASVRHHRKKLVPRPAFGVLE